MSMQIVEKSGEGLSRVYGVTVPVADLTERFTITGGGGAKLVSFLLQAKFSQARGFCFAIAMATCSSACGGEVNLGGKSSDPWPGDGKTVDVHAVMRLLGMRSRDGLLRAS